MKQEIQKIIKKFILNSQKSLILADFKIPEVSVDYPKVENFGDYSTNVAMVLGRMLNKNPMEIAETLKLGLKDLKKPSLEEAFEKIEVVAPGYINFFLSQKYLQDKVTEINKQKEKFGDSEMGKGEKIHLDFVSANPTGPVHLGNGRGGPSGDSLANVLVKNGYKPWREYYVNDYGNQIKVLGHSILKDSEAQYSGGYIDELRERIKSEDPFEVGQEATKVIIEEIIKPSMEKLGIYFDNYFSEKSLHDSGETEKVFQEFFEKNLFYENEGAVWFRAEKFGDEKDRVVKKTSGEVTYFGGDIAYHKNKFARGFNKVIDIWGADHHGDVKRVLGAIEALDYGGKAEIILTQFVRVIQDGKEVKMSKRKGTYVSIDDLVEEVGKDAVRFFFLMYSPDTHMTFDLDLAKERSEKNPVFYVQYAHARISSILRKAESANVKADLSLLIHEKELSLIKELNKFPELIEEIAQNYEVHRLPHYAIKLADKFHSFYNACKVLDKENPELSSARLNLINAVKIVLAETLRLIGVSAPEKM
jgi:arginyl-tRNA synthetase